MHDILTTNETQILTRQMPATYDEVMLNWPAAEFNSCRSAIAENG